MRRLISCLLLFLLLGAGLVANSGELSEEYRAEIEQFRADREERLRSTTGWLTLVGLHWLKVGENRFGSDPDGDIVLSADGVPAWAGSLHHDGTTVRLKVAPGATITIEGEPVTDRVLGNDNEENTDTVELGRLRFYVLKRGERYGIRVKDPEHPRLRNFKGLEYFPLGAEYRIDAELKLYDEPKEVEITTVVGTVITQLVPGVVEFAIGDRQLSLQPLVSDPEETSLWFIFKDLTSGKETYGFRYLYADLVDGRVDLDFNRAYNPPCAFSPYATCPLPPKANRLDAGIESGERIFRDH